MVIIEGIAINAKKIPKQQLNSIWQSLSKNPLPKVCAFVLEDEDFNRIIRLKRCEADLQRELEEWGYILTTEGTDACVFNIDNYLDAKFMILIRKNPYHSFVEIIAHELSHIAKGDL
jgi:hypothetical protein